MATFLFDSVVFGPVRSRRLGVSLGINLMPVDHKVCSFDCIYCECGYNPEKGLKAVLPSRIEVAGALEAKLIAMKRDNLSPDVITFAGNGEPTLHNEFAQIIDDTIMLRDKHCPKARIAVLSNASRLKSRQVFDALLKVDDNIQKLDSGLQSTIELIDRPNYRFSIDEVVAQLASFNGNVTIQTMFVKGETDGIPFDNTSPEDVEPWIEYLKVIKPRQVMIYTIERDTPLKTICKVSVDELNALADIARRVVDDVVVSG
jgi:wyosine [tRNA(Phe)-imidazoG37] synthetase (radical SAM superfamily)